MMSTTVGETIADFLNVDLGFGMSGTSIVVGILFAETLYYQMSSRSYQRDVHGDDRRPRLHVVSKAGLAPNCRLIFRL